MVEEVLIDNKDKLSEIYKESIKSYENIILVNKHSSFTLEEYMVGENWNSNPKIADYCSVETIVQNGEYVHIGISDRTLLIPPFRESGYITPSNIEDKHQKEIINVVERALEALNINNMMTYTEVKFTKEGPKIIEVNGRPGGTVPFKIQNATDNQYDLFLELAKLSLRIPINKEVIYSKYAGSKVSHCPVGKYRIQAIDFSKLNRIDSMTLMIPIKQSGDFVSSFKGIEDILGLYYLENNDVDKLINDMNLVDDLLMVKYDETSI